MGFEPDLTDSLAVFILHYLFIFCFYCFTNIVCTLSRFHIHYRKYTYLKDNSFFFLIKESRCSSWAVYVYKHQSYKFGLLSTIGTNLLQSSTTGSVAQLLCLSNTLLLNPEKQFLLQDSKRSVSAALDFNERGHAASPVSFITHFT